MPFVNCFPCLKHPSEDVITKLDYSNKLLSDVFPDVWLYERTLEELYLASTRICNLPPQLFYCQSLRILVVENNSLEEIPNAIGSLRQLHHLNLSRNSISNIPDNIKACKNLTCLDLSCNNLQRLPDAITCLISLQELLLNETYLEFLPANFGRLVNLKILELRLNNLVTLPKSMARLSNLQRIDIGGNEFTELPEAIGELKQLRELWIDLNQINRISPNIGKLRELQHFESNGNAIRILPHEISHWRNIEVLSVSTNSLESLPFSIGMIKTLVTLKCESNDLQELPDSISNMENLEELVLSHNKLVRLPSTICMLRKLQFLFADDNELRALPDEICSCSNLSVLSVNRNKITELPQDIGHLSNLKVLNIVDNYIVTLPVSVLSLMNLTSLWISNNQSQPLVPFQYVNGDTKMQLTCFMLPQKNVRTTDIYNLNGQQIQQNNIGNLCTSPSKKICFAEETTVLLDTPNSVHTLNLYNMKETLNQLNQIECNDVEDQLSVRLMRSPTPYPKELRLMAKYIRNGQKSPQKSLKPLNIKEPRVMTNSEICDTNELMQSQLQVNTVDAVCNESIYTSDTHNIYKGCHESQFQEIYGLTSEVPPIENISQFEYQQQPKPQPQPQPQPNPHLDSYNAYYTAATNDSVRPRDFYNDKQSAVQIPNSYIDDGTSNFLKPPYHIARVLTKTTNEELLNCETQRNQQQQQQQQYYVIQNLTKTPDQPQDKQLTYSIKEDSSEKEINSNLNFHANSNQYCINDQTSSIYFDCQNNYSYLDNGVEAEQIRVDVFEQNTNEDNPKQLQLNDKAVLSNNQSSLKLSERSNKKSSWLFGVHKNPTVKQVTLKWENQIGFEIAEIPDKDGIYISSILPNTNAARFLCIEDKILEIDGYDFTNININYAKQIIMNFSSLTMNIMLSRK